MMLICSVCGKLYAYESKICKQCEDYAIHSGLIKKEVSLNNFLVSNNLNRFGKVEHHDLRIQQPPLYDWNCNRDIKVLGFKETEPNYRGILEFSIDVKTSLIFE